MPTLDYATQPARKPPRDRPVSGVAAGGLLGFVALIVVPAVPLSRVGSDLVWLVLAVALAGGLAARWAGRGFRHAGLRGWWAMVALPLTCGAFGLILALALYNLAVPSRAFHNVFGEFPPSGAALQYSPRRNFGAGGHCFYFHADAATVNRLVAGAGLTATDPADDDSNPNRTPPERAIWFLWTSGWSPWFAPAPPAVDPRFFSRGRDTRDMRLVFDAATGEVWAVKEGW